MSADQSMLKTKEHYELINHFERIMKTATYGMRFEKEEKEQWPRKQIYKHGYTNEIFLAFRAGYGLGKVIDN